MLLLFFNCVEGLAARDSASDTATILLLKVGSNPSAKGAILVQRLNAPVRVESLLLLLLVELLL
jgi:hypothetical protein